jgi:hypothetical protein
MKLIRIKGEQLVFEISRREKGLLFEILKLYPLVSPAQYRLSQTAPAGQFNDHQRLLEESLAAQREENRKNVRALLTEPGRFQSAPEGLLLKITRSGTDWLLQVLNDIRVGSWIALGSPDPEQEDKILLNEKTAPQFRSMEIAGAFEMVFLNALSGHTRAD